MDNSPSGDTDGAIACNLLCSDKQSSQIHKLKRKYLDVYAYEIAFREDTGRQDNGSIFARVLEACLRARPSRDWSAYWQGNKRLHDSVVSFEEGWPVRRLYVAPVKTCGREAVPA